MISQDSPARVVVACGSLLLHTGAVPEAIHADAAIVSDVTQELAALRLGSPALAVPLARSETTATLLARAHSLHPEFREFREASLALGTVELHDGLGMLASLGRVAGLLALEDGTVHTRIGKDLVIPLMRLRNGTLRNVTVWQLNSLAGGVGALTGALFSAAAARGIRELSDANIDILAFQVGAFTFLGLGDRIFENTAAGLIEQLALLTDRDRDPRESRQILLTELPTVDSAGHEIAGNRTLRSALAISLASAYAAGAVERQVQATRTNRALGLSLSGVTILRADWHGTVAREEVVAQAARYYLRELETPVPDQMASPHLEFFETQVSSVPKSSAELCAVAARSRNIKPESFDGDAMAEAKFTMTARVEGVPIERVTAEAVEGALEGGHSKAINRLKAMSRVVRTALATEHISETRESNRAAARLKILQAGIDALFPEGINRASARRFLFGARGTSQSFVLALNLWREVQARQARATARRLALEAAASAIDAAMARIQSFLGRLSRALDGIGSGEDHGHFRFSPLNEVSADFIRCIASGDIPLLRSHLARSAREVTAAGLAAIIRAGGSEPGEIVARLIAAPQFSAPYWGGGEPSAPAFFRSIVLPPLPAALLSSLNTAARDAGMRGDLVAGDTLAAGAAVVALELYEVRSMREIFTAPYLSGLREIAGPKSSLYPLGLRAKGLMNGLLNGEAACA